MQEARSDGSERIKGDSSRRKEWAGKNCAEGREGRGGVKGRNKEALSEE